MQLKDLHTHLTSLIKKLPETGKRLWHDSLPEYLINSPDLEAALIYLKYWTLNYWRIAKFNIEV